MDGTGADADPERAQYFQRQIEESVALIDKDASFRYRVFGEALKRDGHLAGVRRMLCVGCRNAYELDYYQGQGIEEVLGIDLFSTDPRIRIMDMHHMDFPDARFDLLYSGDNFEHALDPAQAAKEFVRVVRPGGVIMLSVPANTRVNDVDRVPFSNFDDVYAYFRPDIGEVLLEEGVPDDSGTIMTLRLIFRTAGVVEPEPQG